MEETELCLEQLSTYLDKPRVESNMSISIVNGRYHAYKTYCMNEL